MIFDGRSLSDLSLDDFRALIDSQIPEGPHLDYKQTAYSGRPQDRREMLRDVTAFANSEGGYLILGMEEDQYSRASRFVPIDDPQRTAQAINQTCLDGIRDRIEGLEVKAYEISFNQGLIVIRVPPSQQRPHMVALEQHTDFFRRYGEHKQAMTIEEIRRLILENPLFRRIVELELQAHPEATFGTAAMEASGPPYVQIYTERPVERFLYRYLMGAAAAQVLVIVSPFIGDLTRGSYDLKSITEKVNTEQSRLYVITRPPREEYQRTAMSILEQCPNAEIRYNPDVHAKLYVCWSRDESESFALFGSGNLTDRGLKDNIELGMMIFAHGYGRTLVRQLYQWSSHSLRTTSERVKPIGPQPGGKHGVQ